VAVGPNPETNCTATCTVPVARGSTVTLTAISPGDSFAFDGWTGACRGTAGTCQVTMDSDKTATARFVPMFLVNVTVQTDSAAPGCCAVNVSGATTTRCTPESACGFFVKQGARLTFTAVSLQPAWQPLNAWGGDCASVEVGACTLTINAGTDIQKTFVQTG
jgi:hypothetical protein